MSQGPAVNFFTFLSDHHPLTPLMASQRSGIAQTMSRQGRAASVSSAEIKVSTEADGRWRPERLTCRLEAPPGADPKTWLWLWCRKTSSASLHEFPQDPYIPGLSDWIATPVDHRDAPLIDVKVLRYVPTRRVTFSARLAGAGDRKVIVKFKRRSKLAEAAERLARVHAASAQTPVVTARMQGVLPRHTGFVQDWLPGRPFDNAISRPKFASLMLEAGRLHARLHALDVADMPNWSLDHYVAGIGRDIDWITFMQPDAGRRLAALWQSLAARLLAAGRARHVFCHGDFVPGQLLLQSDGIAVTDFDLARRGLDVQEIAKWIAALKYHIPDFAGAVRSSPGSATALLREAEEAYVAGYERQSGRRIDRGQLGAFIAAAEIHYLAIWLKKDRFAPGAFGVALERVAAEAGSRKRVVSPP
jgi:aminoglycoside phosphotransferase (APT) family kinase protein